MFYKKIKKKTGYVSVEFSIISGLMILISVTLITNLYHMGSDSAIKVGNLLTSSAINTRI